MIKPLIMVFALSASVYAGDDDLSYNYVVKCVERGVSTVATSHDLITGALITTSNSPAWDGTTYTFNGSTHLACYTEQATGNFQTNDFFTVYAVFSTTNTASFKGIIGKYKLSPDQGWFMATFKSGANVLLYGQVQSNSTNYLAKWGNTVVNDGNFHVGTMVYNGEAVTNNFFLYVDGTRQTETVDRGGTVATITSAAPIVFGSREVGAAGERISGQFRHFEVFKEAHTQSQVSKHTTELKLKYITR